MNGSRNTIESRLKPTSLIQEIWVGIVRLQEVRNFPLFPREDLSKLLLSVAATNREMSPSDTDLVEITLQTLLSLDKLLDLLRQRRRLLDLLRLRLQYVCRLF